MPLPLSTAQRNALRARRVSIVWLFEIELDEETIRICSLDEAVNYDGHSWAAGVDSWDITGRIGSSSNLTPEPLTISFDGGDQFTPGTVTYRILNQTWHLRPVKLIGLMLDPDTSSPIGEFVNWEGSAEEIQASDITRGPSTIVLTCEGGSFRALSRNLTRCTDADQRLRVATDGFFRNTGIKPSQNIPFGVSWSNAPGTGNINRNGGGGGGGGGLDFGNFNFDFGR